MFSICRPVLTWVWIWIVVAATCALVVVVGQQTWDDDFTQDGTSTNNPQQSTNTLAPSTTSNRRLLFRPESLTAFPTDGPDSDWNINYPFPAHSRTNVNPFPLHIALDALSSPQRYTFQVIPSMRVGATLVGFDWKRNRTIGTMVHSSSGSSSSEFVWSDGLPNWLSYVAPSSSADRSFSLVVTVPQSGNHSVLYLSPQPVQITFHAVLQYQMPQPVMDEETEDDNETTGNDDSQSHATRPLSPSSSSPNLSAQPPLILIEELQTVTLLVSLSITPPLSERVLGIPSYSLSQAPNLLDSHVRIKNRRGSPQTTAGLPPFRMDWRDEIVYACQDAIGAECDICTDASIGWINMTSPYCAFPSGSFFNVESGQLRVRRPIHISGQLQINHGAIFEINHGSDSVESSILNGVSIIDCRDEFGQPKPIINQGTIRVQKGHLLIYSPMLGDGRIEAHRGGSIEFISLAANDEPFYFNHSQLPTLSSNPNLAGMTIQHLHRQSLKANIGRSLLQIVEAGDGASTIEVGTSALTSSATPLESTPTSLTGTDQPGEYDTNDATTVSTTAIGNNETSELGQSSSSTGSNDPIAPISFSSPGSSTESSSVLSTASILFSSSSTGLSSTGSSTGLGLSSSSTGTSPTSQFSQSNSTSSSSSSSSVYYSSSTGSHQPPVEPSVSNSFTPHPTAILLSYGGGLLFTHGTFIFLAPFQSSLTDGDLNSAASVNRNVANRFTVSPHAHVIFDQLPNLQSNSNHNSSVLPSDHLITATQFHNLGHLSVWNSTCNFTSILFFKSFGLLNFTSSSRVLFDISDNLIWNRLDGWNGWRGLKMTSRQLERRKEIIQFIAKRIEEDNTPMTTSNTPADNGTMSEDTPPSIPTNPTDESTSISTSLASLLSSSPLDPVINRCTSGGVGLIVDGFLVFRSGKMNFTGGILARRLSHIFVKKGSEWNFQLELSGSNFDDDTFNDPTAASFVQFGGIELSLDGVWNVRRGRLNILTPLLQIEGHGQLMAQGDQTRIRMDTERVNKPIHLMRMTGVTSEAVPTELIENPDIDQDQSADLYTFANTSATSSSPTTPLALPSYRESLISRCLISSGCESFLITDGARLTLAPLTFLHFLPRSMITVQSTRIEGGAIILDSNVYFRGNSFIQNSSDPSALVNGAAIATAGIHIGNESIIDITDITDGNSYTPATCMIAFGNITGNGRMRCQSRPIQFDSAFIYPSFYSTSPFSIITPVIPSIDDTMSSTAVESPSIRLIGDVEFTPQTTVMLDIFGFHSVSTLSVSGSSLLGGTLWLNGSLHEWPFDPKLINGSTANVNVADRNTSTNTSSMPLNSTSASPPPPTMDSILVFSSEMGLLPFTAPKHFTSIRLTSLIDILPTGFSLDFTYEKTPLKPFNMSQFIDPTSSIPMSPNPSTDHLYETQLWFRTYTPDFTPNQPKTIRNETNHGHRQLTVSAISFFLSPILLILLPLNLSPF